ncbi:Bud-site selection protein [Rhizodiscina lignyota]|uniref:Bud-site selection protein n=1 Tax=Rhizodiscina lignyota TaxID=1504668 RepID=A0A9P4ICD4_9PEZI|nr:Bud-site selection protein [Rhizodiscina lignyota]
MAKRKRGDANDEHARSSNPASSKAAEREIQNGIKQLTRALKLAQGFERQKLGRRLKTATKAGDESQISRINDEIRAVKNLDSRTDLAQHHLYKVLLRVKQVASSPLLPPYVRAPPKTVVDNATANVTARLYNANPTKEAMDEVLNNVRRALGLEASEPKANKKARRGEQVESPSIDGDEHMDQQEKVRKPIKSKMPDEDLSSGSDIGHMEEYAGRLASSSDEEDVEEDDEEDNEPDEPSKASISKKAPISYKPSASQSPSPQRSPTPELSDSASPPPSSNAPGKPMAAPSKRNFLPSLTMGGYWSGSESEPEDLAEMVAPRKNRRGQRARQMIWEKKYGAKAKHLKNQKVDRNADWDPKRGARESGVDEFGRSIRLRRDKDRDASGANQMAITKPRAIGKTLKRDDEGELHPSWQARKKAKEKAAAMASAAFQGTKIVFD